MKLNIGEIGQMIVKHGLLDKICKTIIFLVLGIKITDG